MLRWVPEAVVVVVLATRAVLRWDLGARESN